MALRTEGQPIPYIHILHSDGTRWDEDPEHRRGVIRPNQLRPIEPDPYDVAVAEQAAIQAAIQESLVGGATTQPELTGSSNGSEPVSTSVPTVTETT